MHGKSVFLLHLGVTVRRQNTPGLRQPSCNHQRKSLRTKPKVWVKQIERWKEAGVSVASWSSCFSCGTATASRLIALRNDRCPFSFPSLSAGSSVPCSPEHPSWDSGPGELLGLWLGPSERSKLAVCALPEEAERMVVVSCTRKQTLSSGSRRNFLCRPWSGSLTLLSLCAKFLVSFATKFWGPVRKFVSLNVAYIHYNLFSRMSGIKFKSRLLTDSGRSYPLQRMSDYTVMRFYVFTNKIVTMKWSTLFLET